jgi:DNA-3-methyladenine glycosylase
MKAVLPQTFFNRDATTVAKELIGCYLVTPRGRFMITETEAYDGCEDLACHASKGRTPRTEVMYGEGGHIYTYLIYGMYWMLNIITGPKDYPAGVLIRGIEGVNGPGRVTMKLGIDKSFYGKKLGKETGLWIEEGEKIPDNRIEATARIGVDYAGPIWAKKEWRFVLRSLADETS